MRKSLMAIIALVLSSGVTQVQASSTIENIFYAETSSSGYFNCAYKHKIASKKCLVTTSIVRSSIDARTKAFYGTTAILPLMTIKWPDGDISRYITMDSFELINLSDKKSYQYKMSNGDYWEPDLTEGAIILDEKSKEHIRLW